MKKIINVKVIIVLIFLIFSLFGCGSQQSDESILRKEFDVPAGATIVSYKSSPDKSGWFGREGLKIDIVFQLNDKEFEKYLSASQKSEKWNLLPIPRQFLLKMGGIESTKKGLLKSFEIRGEKPSAEGSIYNPTEEQLYKNFIRTLPLKGINGLYQCRTAGDNIMHNSKNIIQKKLEKDLNDFMLAVLDFDEKRLIIIVSTKY